MDNRFILTPYFFDRFSPTLHALHQPGWQMNLAEMPGGSTQERIVPLYHPLADFVAETAAQGQRPVSIAGDCCASIPVLAGLQRAGLNPVLLWLDAHGDFNTWETTPSGFLGGMPLAMMTGRGEQTLVEAVRAETLPDERVVVSDVRDLDPPEKVALEASRIHIAPDLQALLSYPLLDQPLWVHFDTDIVNPEEVPAMSYPAKGGPSAAEVGAFLRALAQTKNLVAISVTTWTPRFDADGRSQEICMRLVGDLLGD